MMNSFEGDPDFLYLQLPKAKLLEIQGRPYDGKKSVWAPTEKDGFSKAEVISTKGDEVTVKIDGGDEKTFNKDRIQQMNPPKFDLISDMANMTFLNEACVLNNLRIRYTNSLIYTYSGLFCIAINPYRRLPIYTPNVVGKYQGKRRTEMPPHLFSIADNAYSNMIRDRENQSMLITGESGAGKTENTKKVISYFAMVAAGSAKKEESLDSGGTLENRIVQTNPVLEAWGNAKTVRNNNSSRFGKFIRIHFGPNGKIACADIESYLLEKSRITYQMPGLERNYHIFYWLLSGQVPDTAAACLLSESPGSYSFINQGCLEVDNMDDKEEMKLVDEAFTILGFDSDSERMPSYKISSSVLHFGEMKFKQRGEQAEADGTAEAEKCAHLLGVNATDLVKALLTPKVKVGTEWVTKGQTMPQVLFATQALSKCMYARFFSWLVGRANKTLETKSKRQFFIGVLDIAGFEIFEFNTFEQLCINYTNECLQQFFNHHMFVLEQEEYKKEGIQWEFIDFGMDLQSTIELIEKPMGILSILQEECMFPKASDKTFLEKLYDNHLKKSKMFGKPKPNKNAKYEPHFEVYHYAGTVQYNINGWLNKNKDPINECVVQLFAESKDQMVASFFKTSGEGDGGGKKKKKGASMQTISATHKEQLHKLMTTLRTTAPHFVRCLIPNEQKQPGLVEAHLVLHQLQCNGVLEGIRICRKGFPNRILYPEFKQRYAILAPNAVPTGFVDGKEASGKILGAISELDQDSYRLGHTKVFFKAGVLGQLEEWRDEKLTKIVTNLQGWVRGYLMRANYNKLCQQRQAFIIIQRNVRKWLSLRTWIWWKIYTRVKPLLNIAKAEDGQKKMQEEFEKTKEEMEKMEKKNKALEEQNFNLSQQKDELTIQLKCIEDGQGDSEERLELLLKEKQDFEEQLRDMEERITDAEGDSDAMNAAKRKTEDTINKLKEDVESLELSLNKSETEKNTKENQIKTLTEEMARQDEAIAKLNKEKKNMDENNKKLSEDLQAEEDKVNHLNKLKQKLEHNLDDLEETLEHEKKIRSDVEKTKRKIEGELKQTQETVEELENAKHSLEDNLKRRETDMKNLEGKLEDEQSQVAQLKKKIKELLLRIEELEQELEVEHTNRGKVEKQRAQLQGDLDELSERLDEAGGATQAQVEVNKKREAELAKLRRDLEEAAVQNEHTIAQLRKKQNDTAVEMQDQMENLTKLKGKSDKEKNQLKSECDDLQSQIEHVTKQKNDADRNSKSLHGKLNELNSHLDDANRQIQDFTSIKSKFSAENTDLIRQLEEAESQLGSLSKAKQTLSKQLDEVKGNLEEETRQRQKFSADVRNMQGDLDAARDQLEEESEGRADLQRLLQKASNEAKEWRQKCEFGEGGVRSDEFDDLKRKMSAKVMDAEAQLEAALSRTASAEKNKHRLQGEIEDMQIECERAQAIGSQAEKRQCAFDKTIDEWKRKVTDLQQELDNALKESRANAAEVYRMRAHMDEGGDVVEALRRENKNLSEEIHDLTDQLGEGGRSVHELEKSRKRLEMEKEELQSALEEAEAALEQEEIKVQRAQVEINQIRQDIDRRLAEKDEEFESTRKNHQRAIESIQASLEAEARGRSEAIRAKKKLESDINELEVSLDSSNRIRAEAEKGVKKFQTQMREIQSALEDEQRHVSDIKEQYGVSERHCNLLAGEVEELRTQLESSERGRKTVEAELHETSDRVSELSSHTATLIATKRKLENDVSTMQVDLEDQASELKAAGDAAKKAMADASHLAEELRQEQDHATSIEKMRRNAENQVKELQARLDEAEASVLKGGKRMIQKLEQRVRELEVELDNEQRRYAETTKNLRKQDRRLKELSFQSDEDKKQQERMADMVDKLQQKIKTYKRQVEEAEEIAAVNLAKYRKVQQEMEDAEERADMAENTLAKLRAKNRSSVSMSRSIGASATKVTIKKRSMDI